MNNSVVPVQATKRPTKKQDKQGVPSKNY